MAMIKIDVRSHHFTVRPDSQNALNIIWRFDKQFVPWESVKTQFGYKRQPDYKGKFSSNTENHHEYRFHINVLEAFYDFLKAEHVTDFTTSYRNEPTFELADITVKPSWVPYDYQEPIIEYCAQLKDQTLIPRSKFVALQTGKGKGLIAMKATEKLGMRVAVCIRPMYIEKWLAEIEEKYEFTKKDVLIVKGSSHLIALQHMAANGELNAKLIIISNKTMLFYLKSYETGGKAKCLEEGHLCAPDEFFEFIGAGVRVIDEAHQDFHLNFKLDLFTHVKHSISLSATLISEDSMVSRMHQIAYPDRERYDTGELDRYAAAISVFYNVKFLNKLRFVEYGSKRYSHVMFEQSLIKHPQLLNGYVDMLVKNIDGGFMDDTYKAGDRCLVFVATVELASILTRRLREKFPAKDIRKYTQEDDLSDIMTADITVSTIQSAGTAIDIPNLTTVIMTVVISSIAANIQALGRLRKLKDGRTPKFFYWACQNIHKHMDYHLRKKEMLRTRSKSFRECHTNVWL